MTSPRRYPVDRLAGWLRTTSVLMTVPTGRHCDEKLNRAKTASQLSLFDALGPGLVGRVRVHVAIRDRARRQAITTVIARSPKLSVVTGATAYNYEVDVRVFDDISYAVGEVGGFTEATAPGIIVGSGIAEESLVDALCSGIAACVPPGIDRKTLEDVLIRVAGGECMLLGEIGKSRTAAKRLVTRLRHFPGTPAKIETGAGTNPFSERERQIMSGIAKGHSSPVIAGELSLSVQTVKNYVTGILTKTGARNRAHAVAVATDRGWLN